MQKQITEILTFLGVTIDGRRRIIEATSDNEVIASMTKYPQAESMGK